MRGFAKRISFALQSQQEGYGHAVFQTKSFANGEMVLLGLVITCSVENLFRPTASLQTWRAFPVVKVFPL